MSSPDSPLQRSPRESSFLSLRSIVVLVVLAIAAVAAVSWRLAAERRRILSYWEDRLTAVAEHRADVAGAWLDHQRDAAAVLALTPAVRVALGAEGLRSFLVERGVPFDRELEGYLGRYRERYALEAVHLSSASGRWVASAGDVQPGDEIRNAAQAAIAGGSRVEVDWIGAGGQTLLAIAVPVQGYGSSPPIGAVVVVADLSQELFPLILADPAVTATGETVLVEEIDGRSRVLSRPPLWPADSAVPEMLTLEQVAPALGEAGGDTFGEFVDYRGKTVLAAKRSVADSDWRVVRKIDRDEALVEYWRLRSISYTGLALLFLLGGLAVYTESQRRQARAAALELVRRREELAYAERIVANISQGVLLLDENLTVKTANPAGAALLGPEVELVGKRLEECLPVPWARERSEETLRSGQPLTGAETSVVIGGKPRVLVLGIAPILLSGGSRQVLVTVEDVTERRREEERIRTAQQLESLGRLAGGVAHDFNNALTVIKTVTELALQDLSPDHPLRSDLEQIQASADHAASLTRQLLAFARRQVLQPEVLDLNLVLEQLLPLLSRLVGEDIEVSLRLHPGGCTVLADRGQLEQVIMNLATNARDAMPEGGLLTIESSIVELDAESAASHPGLGAGSWVVVTVSDTGIGMPPEVKERVFEPFFTTKDPGRGTGLGLATVYGIVRQSGGVISVYSEPGEGTTFRIYLPLYISRSAEESGSTRQPPAMEALRGSETILLVEDDPAVRSSVRRVLESYGYTVLEASGLREALALAARQRFDLVLTDVVMPGGSGKQVVDALAQRLGKVKALYVSGYTENHIAHRGVLDPGVSYLSKPFTAEELARKVREVLDG